MTDEEMAEEYADSISGLELTCSLLAAKDKNHAYRLGRYDGFLAGLKAGKDMAEADLATVAYMQGASRNKAELDKAKEIIKKYNDVAEKILTYKKRDIEKISKIKKCAESFLEGERNCTSRGRLNNGPGTVHEIEYRA